MHPGRGLAIAALAALAAGMIILFYATQRAIVVEINGTRYTPRTHERDPEDVLRELGIALLDEDRVVLPTAEEMAQGKAVQVDIARTVHIVHDGSITRIRTHAGTLGEAIEQAGVVFLAHDQLQVGKTFATPRTVMPRPLIDKRLGMVTLVRQIRRPIELSIHRAVSVNLQDGPIAVVFYTTSRTVGEALHERSIVVYEGDRVFPGLDTQITPGLSVYLERSKPVVLDVGGHPRQLRTRVETVADLIADQAVALGNKDYVVPEPRTPIMRDLWVSVVRVYDEYLIEEIPIAYQERMEPDPNLEIDHRYVALWGQEGAQRRRVRVRYENEQELYRIEEEAWIAREPIDRVIKYGSLIILRELETPTGTVTYWRNLRMLATSYNAPTAGKPMDHPTYGITRTGVRARKGIIAVDPRVIPLGQPMYVPGYGEGVAGDTGGAIKWRRLDLCYDDDNLVLWKKWVDAYLLTPVPPRAEIEWIIPNWPLETG